jgi:hypothetical protein
VGLIRQKWIQRNTLGLLRLIIYCLRHAILKNFSLIYRNVKGCKI